MKNRYYEPDFDLDGTAEELYIQAQNGYIDIPEHLHRVKEILQGEGMTEEAIRVGFMEEREQELDDLVDKHKDPDSPFSVGQLKLDLRDNIPIEDRDLGGEILSVQKDNDGNVLVSVDFWNEDEVENERVHYIGAAKIPEDGIEAMDCKAFEKFVCSLIYYAQETEREPMEQKEDKDMPMVKKPLNFRMVADIEMNREIDEEMDEISPGGYTMVMNGKERRFDFEGVSWSVAPEEPTILHIECEQPAHGYEDTDDITLWDLKNISDIPEIFVFTGEKGETDLSPFALLSLSFEAETEHGFVDIDVPDKVIDEARVASNIDVPDPGDGLDR